MKQARIRTTFGDVRIDFNSDDELRDALSSLGAQIDSVQAVAGKVLPPEPRAPKPGLEHVYRFLPSGRVELFVHPNANTKLVALALHAYSPELVSAKELEDVTGVPNVVDSVLKQTKNQKYFRKSDDAYGLTPEGFTLALSAVPPSTRSEAENQAT